MSEIVIILGIRCPLSFFLSEYHVSVHWPVSKSSDQCGIFNVLQFYVTAQPMFNNILSNSMGERQCIKDKAV